jgi:hypothetical protein
VAALALIAVAADSETPLWVTFALALFTFAGGIIGGYFAMVGQVKAAEAKLREAKAGRAAVHEGTKRDAYRAFKDDARAVVENPDDQDLRHEYVTRFSRVMELVQDDTLRDYLRKFDVEPAAGAERWRDLSAALSDGKTWGEVSERLDKDVHWRPRPS